MLAGLDWLWRTGIETGMLYVDRDNAPAVRLYESLGFVTTRTLVSWSLDVPGKRHD